MPPNIPIYNQPFTTTVTCLTTTTKNHKINYDDRCQPPSPRPPQTHLIIFLLEQFIPLSRSQFFFANFSPFLFKQSVLEYFFDRIIFEPPFFYDFLILGFNLRLRVGLEYNPWRAIVGSVIPAAIATSTVHIRIVIKLRIVDDDLRIVSVTGDWHA